MKVVTLGLSPYLYLSTSRIHSFLLKHLFLSQHEVACIATFHNTDFFLPQKDEDGKERHVFQFDNYSIPLIPFNNMEDPSVLLYEMLKTLKPEFVVTVGDFNDFLYMKAVKMFADQPFKWLAVLNNYTHPINEKNIEVLNDMDGVLCTNEYSSEMLAKLSAKPISFCHVGCENVDYKEKSDDKFKIMSCGKNLQADGLPTLMKVASDLRDEIPNLELYIHSGVYESGDYDLLLLKERFDPKDQFIRFPDKYVSLKDGCSLEEYQSELFSSDLFVFIPYNSASAISVFEAVSCGCLPVMSNTACAREIAEMLVKLLPERKVNDFLVDCVEVMARGEVYINVPDPKDLKKKILNLYKTKKKGGRKAFSKQFVKSYNRERFLKSFSKMVETVRVQNPTICVEPV
jgi:glycosyltransferase involved in cell wall biosynthesis